MKICVLTHTFPRNDKDVSAAFMKPFADSLVQSKNKVTLITPFDPHFKRHSDPFKIVAYKYIWPERLHMLGYSKTMEADISLKKRAYFLLPFMLLFGILALYRAVKVQRSSIINVHWILPNGLIAFVVSKLTKIPYVVTLPGTDVYLANSHKIFGLIAKFVGQQSLGIVSNSSWLLKRTIDLGIKEKPTRVISYPTDVSMFKPSKTGVPALQKRLGLRKEDFVVLAVGRLVYKKGFDYLITAIAQLNKRYPNVYAVIGGDGDLKEELKTKSGSMGVENNIKFVGNINREEISTYYNMCDVLVAPSIVDKKGNVDGGPVVCLESMACSKPQILTSILGMADVVKNNVNGYVIPEKDPDAIARAIEKLIKSPRTRQKMGKENSYLARHVLSTQKIGQEYTNFFKELLSESVSPK